MIERKFKKQMLVFLLLLLAVSTLLGACSKNNSLESTNESAIFEAGTYEGEGEGFNGPIRVSVTVDKDSIKEIKVIEHSETENIASNAI